MKKLRKKSIKSILNFAAQKKSSLFLSISALLKKVKFTFSIILLIFNSFSLIFITLLCSLVEYIKEFQEIRKLISDLGREKYPSTKVFKWKARWIRAQPESILGLRPRGLNINVLSKLL